MTLATPRCAIVAAAAFALELIVFGTGAAVAAGGPPADQPAAQALAELDRAFTLTGEPVNPQAVNDLLPWLSDSLPGPVAIDVEGAQGANRYFGQVTKDEHGRVRLVTDATATTPAGWVEYEHIGRLPRGQHVLIVSSNSGGSGIFTTLLVVRFSTSRDYDDDHWRTSVVMTRVGAVVLGDRFSGNVTVSGTSIRIGADTHLGKPARTISFE
jgi:hypothetical protein